MSLPPDRASALAGDDGTFGQDCVQKVNRTFRGVPPEVKKTVSVVQGRGLDPRDYVLKPGSCADMTAFGFCKSPRCTFNHSASVIIEPKDAQRFVEK
jgi:hypothetical protein